MTAGAFDAKQTRQMPTPTLLAAVLPALLTAAPVDKACAPARFSAKALAGQPPQARYAAYVKACALPRITELASQLIAFPTVSAEGPAEKSEAFARMEAFLAGWAKQNGLTLATTPKRAVFELSWGAGKGESVLSLVFHGDVVPAPRAEWKKEPFKAVVENGRLFGRGAEDDKGPLAAGLVAVAMAKELALAPSGRVNVVIGNGEESDWDGMTAYAKEAPKARYVISVDSEFPIITAQSGFVAWHLDADVATSGEPQPPGAPLAVDAKAGEFLTQVPGTATLTLAPRSGDAAALAAKVNAKVAELTRARPTLKADVAVSGDKVVLTTHGVAVHSSVATTGQNALWDLAAVAQTLGLAENGLCALLTVVAKRMDQDPWGKKLGGLAYEDPLMGGLLVVPTLLRVDKGKATLSVNMRRPRGRDSTAFGVSLSQLTAELAKDSGGRIRGGEKPYIGEPHVAELEGTLANTLLEIYRRHRGAPDAKAGFIRGGTYARLFPGAVDFGPALPGEPYTGHAPDESIALSTLDSTAQMLAEALYALAVAPQPPRLSAPAPRTP